MNPIKTIGVLFVLAWMSVSSLSQEPPAKRTDGGAKRTIGRDVVYSTSGQEGLKKQVDALFKLKEKRKVPAFPYSDHLQELLDHSRGMGASNIFLVRGDDITWAIRGSSWVFGAGETADRPSEGDDDKKSKKIWLVAYLGGGWSEPARWNLESVEIQEKRIDFRFKEHKPFAATADLVRYFYWVPLDSLKAGTYELRLIDLNLGRPTLARWVEVK